VSVYLSQNMVPPPSWKNPKITISRRGLSDFDKIWHDDAVQPSWPLQLLKIWNFENLKWRRPPS